MERIATLRAGRGEVEGAELDAGIGEPSFLRFRNGDGLAFPMVERKAH
jgi:hypothetical protein